MANLYIVHIDNPAKEKHPGLSLYPDPHQKLMRSILGRDPSSIHVSWETVLCNFDDKATNQQID